MAAPLHRARLAWIGGGGRPETALARRFGQAKFDIAGPADRLILRGEPKPFDLLVVDARRERTPAVVASQLIEASALAGRTAAGVMILAPVDATADQRTALSALGDVVFSDASPRAIVRRARDRLRLAALTNEAGDRLKAMVATRLKTSAPPRPTKERRGAVLVAGAPGPMALPLVNALRDHDLICTLTASQAVRALDASPIDAIVYMPESADDLLFPLSRSLKRRRDTAGLPTYALTPDGETAAAFAIAGVEVLPPAHIAKDLGARVSDDIAAARLVGGLGAFLDATGDAVAAAGPRDAAAFAVAHLKRLATRATAADARCANFSVIGLNASGAAGAFEPLDACRHICRKEDVVIPLGANLLVIVAQGALEADGRKIAARIAGVIAARATEGRTEANDQVGPPAHTDVVSWRKGETVDALLSRLFDGIRLTHAAGQVGPAIQC